MLKHFVGIGILTIAIVIAIGFGIYLSGSPTENRAIRYDGIRIRDFSTLKTSIDNYYADNFRLPSSLTELSSIRAKTGKPYIKKEPKDPNSKQAYTYLAKDRTKYELCANFETSSDDIKERKTGLNVDELNSYDYDVDTSHPKGIYCISYTVAAFLQDRYTDQTDSLQKNRLTPDYSIDGAESTSSAGF